MYTLALGSTWTICASENLKGYGCLSYSDFSDHIQNLILLNHRGGRQTTFRVKQAHIWNFRLLREATKVDQTLVE